MTKTNIVPALGTDDEVTRKNSTISSHYFGYGGGHLLVVEMLFNRCKERQFHQPWSGLLSFFQDPKSALYPLSR
jgi:hypothetical protein